MPAQRRGRGVQLPGSAPPFNCAKIRIRVPAMCLPLVAGTAAHVESNGAWARRERGSSGYRYSRSLRRSSLRVQGAMALKVTTLQIWTCLNGAQDAVLTQKAGVCRAGCLGHGPAGRCTCIRRESWMKMYERACLIMSHTWQCVINASLRTLLLLRSLSSSSSSSSSSATPGSTWNQAMHVL